MYRIISFLNKDGITKEYLATKRSIEYFNPDNHPEIVLDNIIKQSVAFSLEAALNKGL